MSKSNTKKNPFDSINNTENKMANKKNKNKGGVKNKVTKDVNDTKNTNESKNKIQTTTQSEKPKVSPKDNKPNHNIHNRPKETKPSKQNAPTKPKQSKPIKLTGFTTIGISNENLAHLKAIKDVNHSSSLNDVITDLVRFGEPIVTNSKRRENLYQSSLKLHKTIMKLRK